MTGYLFVAGAIFLAPHMTDTEGRMIGFMLIAMSAVFAAAELALAVWRKAL